MKYILLFLPLAMMAYEDFRYRAIHWAWLLLLTAGIVWCFPFKAGHLAFNLVLVAIQLGALTVYFSLKHRRLVYLPDELLGWGDILFYLPLCLLLSPENLIFFSIAALLLTLVFYAAYTYLLQKNMATIPLAGCFSICLMAALTIGMAASFDFQHDSLVRAALISNLNN